MYDLQMSETSLIEYLTEKVRDTGIAKIIVDYLAKPSGSHNLEALCKNISKVQRVAKIIMEITQMLNRIKRLF